MKNPEFWNISKKKSKFANSAEDLQAVIAQHRNSPYPMTQVLKLLWNHYGGIPIEQIQYFLLCGADPAPKLICMQYLSTNDMFDTLSVDEICEYLEAAFTDENGELREEALKLAEKAIVKFKERIVEFLKDYRNVSVISDLINWKNSENLKKNAENWTFFKKKINFKKSKSALV